MGDGGEGGGALGTTVQYGDWLCIDCSFAVLTLYFSNFLTGNGLNMKRLVGKGSDGSSNMCASCVATRLKQLYSDSALF